MIQPRYDHRHTFLLSIGIALFFFGIYPFYVANTFRDVLIKTIVFHVAFIVTGAILVIVGIVIWTKRDKDSKVIVEFIKKGLEIDNEFRRISVERERLALDKATYKQELKDLEEKLKEKKKETKDIEEQHDSKRKEIEGLKEAIIAKEKELIERKNELFDERKKSIDSLPSSTIFGGNLFAAGSTASTNFNTGSADYTVWPSFNSTNQEMNFCKNCGRLIINANPWESTTLCQACRQISSFSGPFL